MKYLWMLYVLLIPTFYYVGKDMRFAQERFFQLGVMVILFASLFVKRKALKFNWPSLWLGVAGLWCVFLFMLSDFIRGVDVIINIMFGILVYALVLQTVEKKDIQLIFRAITGACALNVAFSLVQHFGFDPIFIIRNCPKDYTVPIGFFGLSACLGMYFAISAPIILATLGLHKLKLTKCKKKVGNSIDVLKGKIQNYSANTGKLLGVACVLGAVGLMMYFSRSTGAVLALVFALFFFLWFARKWLFWTLIIPMLIMAVLFVWKLDNPMGMFDTRPRMWKIAVTNAFKHQFTGFGLDSFRFGPVRYYMDPVDDSTIGFLRVQQNGNQMVYEIPDAYKAKKLDFWDSCHSFYVQTLYEMGVPGLVIFFILIFQLFKDFKRSKKDHETVALMAAIIALLVMMTVQFPERLARIGHLMPLLLGLFVLKTNEITD